MPSTTFKPQTRHSGHKEKYLVSVRLCGNIEIP